MTRSANGKPVSNGVSDKNILESPPLHSRIESPYLCTDEAALYLRCSVRALEHFRSDGGGPAYRKHGGSVVYHVHDLDRWSRLRRYSSTSKKTDS